MPQALLALPLDPRVPQDQLVLLASLGQLVLLVQQATLVPRAQLATQDRLVQLALVLAVRLVPQVQQEPLVLRQ